MTQTTEANNMKTEAAKAAKAIKKHLKANGIKCKAKSKNFSMGCSVDIYVQNLLPAVLEQVKEYCERYEYGTFDSMTDCSGVKNEDFDGPQAKYVNVNCSYSDEIKSAAWEETKAIFGELMQNAPESYNSAYFDYDHNKLFKNVFNDPKSAFWSQFKPR